MQSSNLTQTALDLLMLPGVPAQIKADYASLAKRSQDFSLALVEPEYVVLDTETTGFDAKNDALIEVAAAIVSGNRVIETFSTFVNPQRPIPAQITEITNISDADVSAAPLADEVMRELIDFCADRPIIAHNAPFDQAFIKANCQHIDCASKPALLADEPWIDTLELAHIALPLLKEYKLETLSRVFAPDQQSTHRAIDDVYALVKVWRVILVGLSDLPAGLCAYLAERYSDQVWSSLPVLQLFATQQQSLDQKFDIRSVRATLTRHLKEQQKVDAQELEGGILTLKPVAAAELAQEYSPDGLLGVMYPDYETREEQLAMAEAVTKAFNTSAYAAIEAGTGVGKSMAYLLPAALFAKRNGITCGVATKSNALLDQLMYHELPRLNAALEAQSGSGLEYLALKGYDHYPCLRKLLKRRQSDKVYQGEPALMAALLSYVCQSLSGDIDAFGARRHSVPRFEYMASADDCLTRRCRYYGSCLLHSMRRQAKNADIIVTNHSLLFCDVMSEGALLPPVRHWIIDEAHGAEGEARRQLTSELDTKSLSEAVRATLRGDGLVESIRGKAASEADGKLVIALAAKVSKTAEPVDALVAAFFGAVANLVNLGEKSDYNQLELWLNTRIRDSVEWSLVRSSGSALAERLQKLEHDLRDLITAMGQLADLVELQSELVGHTMTIAAAIETLGLILDGSNQAYVYSAQLDRRIQIAANKLVASYYDVGAVLAQDFYPNQFSVVFTSATIALGGSETRAGYTDEESGADFSYFKHGVGLDLLDADRVFATQLDSSYDFDTNMQVFVPLNMLEPNDYGRRGEYLEQLDELLFSVHQAMGGSVLTLFTNRREMEETYERLRGPLATNGLEIICQFSNTSRSRLREQFIADEALSLFALRSFWEGFDAPGDTLRCVVIPKLPFSKPNDPLQQERDRRERSAWSRYVLPEAVISLKQAAGRLIRSRSDAGFLVLADSRLISKSYGKQFLLALPSQNIHYLSIEAIAERMRRQN